MGSDKQSLEQIIGAYASAAVTIAAVLDRTEFQLANADAREALIEDAALRDSICEGLREAGIFLGEAATIFETCIKLVQENQRLQANTTQKTET